MDSDETLARVTYLPGVTPPSETHGPTREASATRARGSAHDGEEHRAQNVSMRALTRRGMSRWEMRELLRSRELNDEVVDVELDRLERVGLIDDASLAETIVRTQRERKGLGRTALESELRRRHIDQTAIDLAMEQLSEDDEDGRAAQLAERRAAQFHGLDHETAVRRLSGYLQRKGYSSDTVRRAVQHALPRTASGVRFR